MRKHCLLFLIPLSLLAQMEPSLLAQGEEVAKRFAVEVAKAPPPLRSPQPQSCLDTASVWFTIDLDEIASPAFASLNQETLWSALREIGVEGVYLKGLKQGGAYRTGIGLDPKWGCGWDEIANSLRKKNLALIGDAIGNSTGIGVDFGRALKNEGDYPGLYHLVEIDKRDWKCLPVVGRDQWTVNVPWLTLQELQKKGYVPEQFNPYVKESSWNTTAQVTGSDGKARRWIYLKTNRADPVIDWLNASFAGCRIATADLLDSIYNLGEKIVQIDGDIAANARETLALWARKLGGFVAQEGKGGLAEMKEASADLVADTLTRPALLHALIAQDAEALKLMYRLFLEEGIEAKRLIHILQPFDQFTCDWSELLLHPRKRFQYYDEILTGEALRMRLLKQDVATLGDNSGATWPSYCAMSLNIQDFQKHREDIGDLHLLLAFFYAMQPGVFSFSVSDLLGTLGPQTVDLMGCNEDTIYASLPGQLQNGKSFAMQLRKILRVRKEYSLGSGELIAVPKTTQPGLLILVHRLRGSSMIQMTAVNFGKTRAQQLLEMPSVRQTTAIDLITGLAEKKPLESSTVHIDLPPLSGKSLLFQVKYYD